MMRLFAKTARQNNMKAMRHFHYERSVALAYKQLSERTGALDRVATSDELKVAKRHEMATIP
jgi:hypothetical protein